MFYSRTRRSRETHQTSCHAPSRTKDSFRQSTDVNWIMDRFEKTGLVTHLNRAQARFGDFSEVEDYFGAVRQIQDVQELFASLPAKVRDACNNDPAEYLDLVLNPENRAEAISLGLIEPAATRNPDGEAEKTASDSTRPKPSVGPESSTRNPAPADQVDPPAGPTA